MLELLPMPLRVVVIAVSVITIIVTCVTCGYLTDVLWEIIIDWRARR